MTKTNAIESLQRWLFRELPIYEHIGATVEQIGATVCCRVPLNKDNRNHFGAVHAALQFAVCEMAGGLAINQSPSIRSGEYLPVVKSLNLEFLKPAMSDVEAVATISDQQLSEIEDSLRANGKVQFELVITLRDQEDIAVAKATGVYYASKRKTKE